MRPLPVVVSTPSLQLLVRIRKDQELMRVQALRPKLAVEGFDEAVIGRFSGPGGGCSIFGVSGALPRHLLTYNIVTSCYLPTA